MCCLDDISGPRCCPDNPAGVLLPAVLSLQTEAPCVRAGACGNTTAAARSSASLAPPLVFPELLVLVPGSLLDDCGQRESPRPVRPKVTLEATLIILIYIRARRPSNGAVLFCCFLVYGASKSLITLRMGFLG
ncbi:unnamed protein product [Boreogadus saida]